MAIDKAPWFRYRPGEIFTTAQLISIHAQIKGRRPHYIVMEEKTEDQNDVWQKTRALLAEHYNLTTVISGYGIWETL